MDPAELPKLLDPIIEEKADYCKGDRLSRKELTLGMSSWRKFGNLLLTQITRISSGYWSIQDPQNGYTAISKEALSSLDLDSVYPQYGYCNDILVKLNVLGFRVQDIEIPARYGDEKSKIRYGRYIKKVSYLLFMNFLWRIKKEYILPNLSLIGITYLMGFSLLVFGLLTILTSFSFRTVFIIGLNLFGRGILIILMSMFFDAFIQKKRFKKIN